ncbi:MAG TPA: LytTR family DNA-binding domain-containing protein [Opitutaceae bacterium]|nr:LytTR family DNA-binding domain-containing protein [Opitutaceae bacterium]
MPNALLIDDEPLAREELRRLLEAHPEIVIVGEAATLPAARQSLQRDDYQVVFLDIQLSGGTGFDLVPDVRGAARIVFVTAYDRFALRAFEVNALDYLLKPVRPDRLASAVQRLLAPVPDAPAPGGPAAESTPPLLRPDDCVYLKTDTKARMIPLAQISAIFSNENYSDVQLRTGERFLTRRTMKAWEDSLPATHFMRVHRQALVNLACIERQRRDTRETAELHVLGAREPVPVSRSYLGGLEARLAVRL